jgi:hypothetical protein
MIGVMLLIGCREKQEIPPDVLSKEQMTMVLMDIYILEAQMKEVDLKFDSAKRLYNLLEQDVFKKHGISDTTYHKSFMYYQDRSKYLDEVYGMVVDSLSLREKIRR